MSFCKNFLISLGFALLFSANVTLVQSSDLVGSAAKLMKVNPDKIELKKQRKGMTSAGNHSFKLNGKKYILKVFNKKQNQEMREKEVDSVKIFSELGLGSKFVASSTDKSFYIREFTPGKTLKYEDLQNDKNLINLAKALRKLHAYKCELTSRSQSDRAEKHYGWVSKKKVATPSSFEDSYGKYKKQYASLIVKPGFCHNDLNPHNIVLSDDGGIHFIDLVNSGNSNIYEELGYVTMLNGIYGEKLETFLKAYFERSPSQDELNAVKLSQKLVCFLTSLVYFDFSESKKDKDVDPQIRIKTLDDMLKSDSQKSAVDMIKENIYISVKLRKKDLVKQYALAFYKSFLEM